MSDSGFTMPRQTGEDQEKELFGKYVIVKAEEVRWSDLPLVDDDGVDQYHGVVMRSDLIRDGVVIRLQDRFASMTLMSYAMAIIGQIEAMESVGADIDPELRETADAMVTLASMAQDRWAAGQVRLPGTPPKPEPYEWDETTDVELIQIARCQESQDDGSTWKDLNTLLLGSAYLRAAMDNGVRFRVARLRNSSKPIPADQKDA